MAPRITKIQEPTVTKICNRCREEKGSIFFYRDRATASGLASICKACRNAYRLENIDKVRGQAKTWASKNKEKVSARAKRHYYLHHEEMKEKSRRKQRKANLLDRFGLTETQVEERLQSQNGKCAICETETPGGKGTWHVDHDHKTEKVRALLCHGCNTGVGLLSENPDTLRKAAAYIEFHKGFDDSTLIGAGC